MTQPFFSIVIPTLNEQKALPILFRDLNKQQFKDFEIVIVDGASVDNTIKEVEKQKKIHKNTFFINNKKRGLCYQRNLGVKHARGKYIVFLDADIQLNSRFFKAIHEHIQKTSAKFVATYQLPDTDNKFDHFLTQIANYTLELLILINKQMAPGYDFIVEKELFLKAGGFDEAVTMGEDHELSIRIRKQGVVLELIRKPLLMWSFRRFYKDGHLPIMLKYSMATVYVLILGKITDKNFSYPMGGEYFKEVLKRRNSGLTDEFSKYLRKIKHAVRSMLMD